MRHLLTWMGTVLCQDPTTKRLVHRPLSARGDAADLVDLRDPGASPPPAEPTHGRIVPVAVARQADTGLVSVSDGTHFLTAEPDGAAKLSRPTARRWERFLLIDAGALDAIRFIVANRWVRVADADVVDAALLPDFRLRLGDQAFPLADNTPLAFARPGARSGPPHRFSLYRDGWKLDDFVLYRPLVYFVAFKGDEVFAMLRLALASLNALGEYDGEVLIIGDRSASQLEEIVPPTMRLRTHVLMRQAADEMDLYASRYWVVDWPQACGFQPLLYVDADVIVDRPIQGILARLVLSVAIGAQEEEDSPLCSTRSVGAGLFAADGVDVDGRNGFCAGILGIPNLRDHEETLRKILETIRRIQTAKQRPRAWRGDQPIANYVAVKTAPFDPALLTPFVRYTRGNMRGGDQPLGFVHFWGSGRGALRIAAMQRYLDQQLGIHGDDD